MRNSGYKFKKGYSRSKRSSSGTSDENGNDEGRKRKKIDKEERDREMTHMKTLLSNIEDQMRIKQLRLDKAKTVKDYKSCDELSVAIRGLLREKFYCEKQLSAFQKKEAKSNWDKKRSLTKGSDTAAPGKVVQDAKKSRDLMTKFLEKKESQDTVDIVDKNCMERNECASLSEKQESLSSKPASSASASVIKADSDKIQAVAPVLAKISQPEDVGNESSSGGDTEILSSSPSSSPNQSF